MLPAICSSSTVPLVAIPVHLATHPVTSKCGDRGTFHAHVSGTTDLVCARCTLWEQGKAARQLRRATSLLWLLPVKDQRKDQRVERRQRVLAYHYTSNH